MAREALGVDGAEGDETFKYFIKQDPLDS